MHREHGIAIAKPLARLGDEMAIAEPDEVDNLLEDQDLSFKRARNHLRQYLVLSEKEKQILREDFAQLGISLPEARLE